MNKQTLKTTVTFTGKILGFAGLAYVLYKLSQEYTLSSFFDQLQQGNMFHFIGRQALASSIGISQKGMAKVSLLHSFLLLAATVFSSTIFAFLSKGIPEYILLLMVAGCIVSVAAVHYTYPSFPVKEKIRINWYLTVSIAMQGLLLGIIVAVLTEKMDMALFFECISIYIISWLIGFATPGASGGLGVREGTFIAIAAFLHVDIPSQIIIFSVLLVRLINILVDTGMYLSTLFMKENITGLKR